MVEIILGCVIVTVMIVTGLGVCAIGYCHKLLEELEVLTDTNLKVHEELKDLQYRLEQARSVPNLHITNNRTMFGD